MKNIFVAIFLLLATFCKGQIHFGSLVVFSDSEHTSGDITDVANQLGIKYIRHTVIMQGWDGTSTRFDQFVNAGFNVILNINYGNPVFAPIPFPTDTDAYKEQLSAILDIHHAEVVVIENEEQTDDYHSGPIQDYINELTSAIEVCHAKGLKVTNGGLLTTPLCIIIYNDYISRGLITQAEDFKNRTFNQLMLNYIANPKGDSDLGIRVANCNTLLAAYAQLNLDYINFHLAEPVNFSTYGDGQSATLGVYKEMVNYLAKTTGKSVMTNETAQKNLSPTLVTSMLNEYKKNRNKICYMV